MAAQPAHLNLIERAIAGLSPKWGMRRMMQKTALAMAGGYTGASKSRATLRNYAPDPVSADDEVAYDLPTLRGRARDLVRNAPIAGAAIGTSVTHVIGTGLSLQSHVDKGPLGLDDEAADAWQVADEREFRLWCESVDCDASRRHNFYGLQSLAFRAMLESGDVFALLTAIERPGSPYSLAVQLIEADRVCNPSGRINSATLVDGIEINRYGEAVAVHIASRHPAAGMAATGIQWTRVPVRDAASGRLNVLHLFDRQRPGQTRGVPMLAPVIEPLKQLQRYTDAELASAVNASIWSVFIKMDPEAFDGLFTNDKLFEDGAAIQYLSMGEKWNGRLAGGDIDEPAKVVNLLPGEDITSATPGRPNSEFDPFVSAIIAQIGARLGIPTQILTKLYDQSYTAARASNMDAWRSFRILRDRFASDFCQPIRELVQEEAIGLGRLSAPGYFSDPAIRKAYAGAQWVGDGPGSLDPNKDVTAARDRVDMGISTLSAESILWDGVPWEDKHRQRAREAALRKRDGLDAAAQATPPAAEPAPPAKARPAEPDDDGQPDAPRRAPGRAHWRGMAAGSDYVDREGVRMEAMIAGLTTLAGSIATMAAREPVAGTTEIHVAPSPAPVVHQDIHVAPSPAPVVHQDIHVAAAAPALVDNHIHVAAPVESAAPKEIRIVGMPALAIESMPERMTETTITRDEDGDMTGSRATERDA